MFEQGEPHSIMFFFFFVVVVVVLLLVLVNILKVGRLSINFVNSKGSLTM